MASNGKKKFTEDTKPAVLKGLDKMKEKAAKAAKATKKPSSATATAASGLATKDNKFANELQDMADDEMEALMKDLAAKQAQVAARKAKREEEERLRREKEEQLCKEEERRKKEEKEAAEKKKKDEQRARDKAEQEAKKKGHTKNKNSPQNSDAAAVQKKVEQLEARSQRKAEANKKAANTVSGSKHRAELRHITYVDFGSHIVQGHIAELADLCAQHLLDEDEVTEEDLVKAAKMLQEVSLEKTIVATLLQFWYVLIDRSWQTSGGVTFARGSPDEGPRSQRVHFREQRARHRADQAAAGHVAVRGR